MPLVKATGSAPTGATPSQAKTTSRPDAAQAGAACVVDASKWPVQALALARAGLDVRVIHLVRDVRGVAYSLGKREVSRPHAVREADVMSHLSPAMAAARWVAVQSQAGLLRRCGLPVTRMRYEEFVRHPRAAVEAALAGIGLAAPPAHLAHIGDGRVVLGTSHGLSGNPSRFRDEITRAPTKPGAPACPGVTVSSSRRSACPSCCATASRPRAAGRNKLPMTDAPARERDGWPLVSVIMPTRSGPELVHGRRGGGPDLSRADQCLVVHDQEPPTGSPTGHAGTG
jgi:hypothetical protein